MKPVLRRIFGALTVVGALASVVAGRERPTLELPPPRPQPRNAAVQGLDLQRLALRAEEPASEEKKVDPFASHRDPAQVPGVPPRAAKPSAPPLPFRYLGKMIEDGSLHVFLARGDESLSVKAGTRIGEYRVDKITDREVVFTYLPLKTQQKLPL